LFKLDDEPNLYIENGCFTISIHKEKMVGLGVPGNHKALIAWEKGGTF